MADIISYSTPAPMISTRGTGRCRWPTYPHLAEKIAVARKAVIQDGIPVRVITAGITFLPKPEEQKAWRKSHERLASSIKGAKLIVAEKSGHMIPSTEPDLIVSVVSEVTRLAR